MVRPTFVTTGAFAAVVILCALCAHVLHQVEWVAPNDDVNYAYHTGAVLLDRQAADLQAQAIVDQLNHHEREALAIRFWLRHDYAQNYLAHSAIFSVLQWAFAKSCASDACYSRVFVAILTAAYAIATALTLLLVATLLSLVGGREWLFALAVVSLVSALETTISLGATEQLFPAYGAGQDFGVSEILVRTIRLLVDSGPAYQTFSGVPRAMLAFLLCAVFAARWVGKFTLSYFLLFALFVLHQSLAGMFLAIIVFVDFTLRAREISIATWILIGLAIIVFSLREALLLLVASPGVLVLTAFLAVSVLVSAWLIRRGVDRPLGAIQRFVHVLFQLRSHIRELGTLKADLVSLALIGAMIYLGSAAVGPFVEDVSSSAYFWSVVAGRYTACLRPVFVFGFAVILMQQFLTTDRGQRWAAGVMVGLAVVPLVATTLIDADTDLLGRNLAVVAKYESRSPIGLSRYSVEDEDALHYVMSKDLLLGRSDTFRLFEPDLADPGDQEP